MHDYDEQFLPARFSIMMPEARRACSSYEVHN